MGLGRGSYCAAATGATDESVSTKAQASGNRGHMKRKPKRIPVPKLRIRTTWTKKRAEVRIVERKR